MNRTRSTPSTFATASSRSANRCGPLRYEFTVDNPSAFTATWTAVLPMQRSPDRLFEYACHEGNYALMNILRGARAQEK